VAPRAYRPVLPQLLGTPVLTPGIDRLGDAHPHTHRQRGPLHALELRVAVINAHHHRGAAHDEGDIGLRLDAQRLRQEIGIGGQRDDPSGDDLRALLGGKRRYAPHAEELNAVDHDRRPGLTFQRNFLVNGRRSRLGYRRHRPRRRQARQQPRHRQLRARTLTIHEIHFGPPDSHYSLPGCANSDPGPNGTPPGGTPNTRLPAMAQPGTFRLDSFGIHDVRIGASRSRQNGLS
jgi:hypothetical protein